MHALVCQGNGKYYVSAVFGYYRDITATDDYQRYLQSIHKPYWIVWDEDKKRLIRWLAMVPNTKYLIPQILIVDSRQDNWNKNEEGVGCVDFLSREVLDSILDLEEQPEAILQQCRAMDAGYVYEELREIKTSQDIEDLEWASGGFHDAFIAEERMQEDGRLYLKFDGTWGCNIEVWFWGDLDYNNPVVEPEDGDPYWYDSTIIQQDGFIYFVDDDVSSIEQIRPGHCHFKARHMQYRIIPN